MKKTTAIELLGGTPGKAAKALGYKAVQTIYAWPDDLPQALQDRIAGVLARTKKPRKKRAAHEPLATQQTSSAAAAPAQEAAE